MISSSQPRQGWDPARPRVLVIACSDGRFQEQTDDFLLAEMSITHYDRFYIPGGPGALCTSGFEYVRAAHYHHECRFLLEAHGIEQVVLLFHSGSADGPEEAMCADYRKKLRGRPVAELRAQQETDGRELQKHRSLWPDRVKVHLYRAEVMTDGQVRFVALS